MFMICMSTISIPYFFVKFREDIEKESQLYGKEDSAFDYSKAPRRGRLEGIRDFTHKKMYLKYYENPDDPQPDSVSSVS